MTTAEFMRLRREALKRSGIAPLPVVGHMPFAGHRTQHEIRCSVEAGQRSATKWGSPREFGFDPEALAK